MKKFLLLIILKANFSFAQNCDCLKEFNYLGHPQKSKVIG